jgi:superfamily II DNA/RNA helicase
MTTTFAALGVPADIARALAKRGITEPFPIQAATIPDGLAGRDLTGKAPTGSGKTIAFGVPMVARVKRAAPKRPKGLVLAPTRELALQVADELRAMSGELRVLAVYGGAGIEPQIKSLRAGVDIVVACPGRLLDLMDRNVCDLRDVSFAVIDEADRMADMGFLPDVRKILDQTNQVRQTVLFSATLDGAIDSLVRDYQQDPVVHEMADEQAGDIVHHFWLSERNERVALLAQIVDRTGPTVVFCRTKHGSDRVARQLAKSGVSAAAIHGNRSQAQRERALRAFHKGEVAALVATDVAARGIHVEGVTCVVHYDIPPDPKDYIHRSGRTGRAGGDGTVVALLDKGQRKDAVKLKKAAGVGDVEITEPDVALLPEGAQQQFRPAKVRDKVKHDGPRQRPGSRRPDRDDRAERSSSHRPSRPERDRPSSSRPEAKRTEAKRPDAKRADRPSSARPDAKRTERSARPERADSWSEREGSGSKPSPSRVNRAARRENQFTDAERAARQEANELARRERTPVRGKPSSTRSKPSGGSGARPSGGGGQTLPAGTAGADKVRPSGASRRKAKREAMIAAGEDPGRAKKKRSGKPRPANRQRG